MFQASLSSPSTSSNGGGGGLKEAVDRALVADFFFILVALAWLVAGVAESSLVGTNNLLTPWYQLWPLVFQPALGLLMAGALVSGAVGWLASRDSADSK